MIEIPNNGRLNFIIYSFHSFENDITGGNLVLHKLAESLAKKNCNVFVFTKPEYPHENITSIGSNFQNVDGKTFYNWEGFTYPLEKTIAVYPQMTVGNPFNVKHVCRWILYNTKYEIEESYHPNDYYFNFGNFTTHHQKSQLPLTIFDYKLEKLFITNEGERRGFCHIVHKDYEENHDHVFQIFNSKNLGDFKTTKRFDFDYLRNELNKYEYFLTYDDKSFFSTAAALCGCKAIIMNSQSQKKLTPLQYRLQNPIQMFGVAYGLDDIGWANKTINFVRSHISSLETLDNATVDRFVEFWENKLSII